MKSARMNAYLHPLLLLEKKSSRYSKAKVHTQPSVKGNSVSEKATIPHLDFKKSTFAEMETVYKIKYSEAKGSKVIFPSIEVPPEKNSQRVLNDSVNGKKFMSINAKSGRSSKNRGKSKVKSQKQAHLRIDTHG